MTWFRSRLLALMVITLLVTSLGPLLVLRFIGLDRFEAFGESTVDESIDLVADRDLEELETRAADIAYRLAAFLRTQEGNVLTLAALPRDDESYLRFARANRSEVWVTDPDTGAETRIDLPLFREVVYMDLAGQEQIKVENVCFPPYPFDCVLEVSDDLIDASDPANTTFGSAEYEDYFQQAQSLATGQVYVSRPVGYYVPLNEAYRGESFSGGVRYQGIVRIVTPVYEDGFRIGYAMVALDHSHILEFTAHVDTAGGVPVADIDPELDNFAYMIGADGSTIAHIRHSAIAGVDRSGAPVPFLSEEVAAQNPFAAPGNFYQMGFLDPVFPAVMEQASRVPIGRMPDYTVGESPTVKSAAYAVVPYYNSPHYTSGRGFGLVILSADSDALRVRRDNLATDLEEDLDAVGRQFSGLVLVALGLMGGAVLLAAVAIVAPLRTLTRYSEIMGERRLTPDELKSLQSRRGRTEVAQLARAFGNMADTVQNREAHINRLLNQTDLALAQRVNELSTLEEVGQQLTATLELDSVLERATEALWTRTGAQGVTLTVDPPDDASSPPRTLQRGTVPSTDGSTPAITVPLVTEGKEIGRYLLYAEEDRIGDAERIFARQLADWVSVAVTNARLYAAVEVQREQLARQNVEVMEANRLKSEFLATVSHELRTPLNAVIGFSDMMLMGISGELNEKQAHQIQRIRDNGKRLLDLVNDILDLARIEAGRVEILQEPFDTGALLDHLKGQAGVLAESTGLQFIAEFDAALPAYLVGDRQRIEQIASNLLSNAFKFTEAGHVRLSVATNTDPGHWTITVADTGIGIPPHALDFIFDEFRQVDGTSTREFKGTGLGLAITKNLVRMMDGKINVDSTLGQGSTFTVSLPLVVPEKPVTKGAE